MLAGGQLLLPGLDLLLARECVGGQDAVDDRSDLGVGGVDVGVTLETLDVDGLVVFVLVLLGGDGELCDLWWGLISGDQLALSADVQDEWVRSQGCVESGMLAGTDAAAVKTLQADIEAVFVVDGVKTLSAVLAVD